MGDMVVWEDLEWEDLEWEDLAWEGLAWEVLVWEVLEWEVLAWEDLVWEDLVWEVWEAWEDMAAWEVAKLPNTVSNHHSIPRLSVMLSHLEWAVECKEVDPCLE